MKIQINITILIKILTTHKKNLKNNFKKQIIKCNILKWFKFNKFDPIYFLGQKIKTIMIKNSFK